MHFRSTEWFLGPYQQRQEVVRWRAIEPSLVLSQQNARITMLERCISVEDNYMTGIGCSTNVIGRNDIPDIVPT